MKKILVKIITCLIAMMTIVFGSAFSANAFVHYEAPTDLSGEYILIDDLGYFDDFKYDGARCIGADHIVYEKVFANVGTGGNVVVYFRPVYNMTTFTVTDFDSFWTIYDDYAEELNYDVASNDPYEALDTSVLPVENCDVVMCDEDEDETESTDKYTTLQAFTRDLIEADAILEANYYDIFYTKEYYAQYFANRKIEIATEDLDGLTALCELYDAVVEISTNSTTGEESYTIVCNGGFVSQIQLADAIKEAFPDASLEGFSMISPTSSANLSFESVSIDLIEVVLAESEISDDPIPDDVTVEEPEVDNLCGDIDTDGAVTPVDAHLALVAYASEQVGLDTGLTEDQMAIADVDGNGVVNAIDAHYMLVYYATEQVDENVSWETILA